MIIETYSPGWDGDQEVLKGMRDADNSAFVRANIVRLGYDWVSVEKLTT